MSSQLMTADRVTEAKEAIKGLALPFKRLFKGDEDSARRMVQVMHNALVKKPALAEDIPSLMDCAVTAAEFNLWPNTPEQLCYIIPYKDRGKPKAQFQLGYHGTIELAYRSGKVENIYAETRYANDLFKITRGTNKDLIHEDADGDRGEAVGYYAVVILHGHAKQFEYWSKEKVLEHAKKFSKAYQSAETSWEGKPPRRDSPWHTNFDSMALKTMIFQACRFVPRSVDDLLFKAMAIEMSTEKGKSRADFGLDPPTFDAKATTAKGALDSLADQHEAPQGSTADQEAPPGDDIEWNGLYADVKQAFEKLSEEEVYAVMYASQMTSLSPNTTTPQLRAALAEIGKRQAKNGKGK